MQCEDCGRILLKKDQRQCPYCGRVYGTSTAGKAVLAGLALLAAMFIWMFLRA